jgi:GNAT superfamily N-acetyltransferase
MVAEIPLRYGETLDDVALAERSERVLAAHVAFTGERSAFLVATIAGQVVGCGALQPLDPETAEVKRMYVTRSWRRQGLGAMILAALVEAARTHGYRQLRLETGDRQPEALALYASAGFRRIEPYGAYIDDPASVCYEKMLLRSG